MNKNFIKEKVKERYEKIAKTNDFCCGSNSGCASSLKK